MSDRQCLWEPGAREKTSSHMARYMTWLSDHGFVRCHTYQELYEWSLRDLPAFWESLSLWMGLRVYAPHRQVLSEAGMPGAKWFEGATLNFSENLLAHVANQPAREWIRVHREGEPALSLTGRDLLDDVARVAQFLRGSGVQVGDRVAAILPNGWEALVGMLAATSLGAIWSSCSPDFGAEAIKDRFSQIEPKVILAVDGYRYAGKVFNRVERLVQLLSALPSVTHVLMVSVLGEDLSSLKGRVDLTSFEELRHGPVPSLTFAPLPFAHPVYILYSSGTTGKPKCIVHGAGGVLLQHAKELLLHTDLQATDHFMYYTTTGWMMWNWMASALMTQCTLHLYDGAPHHPSLEDFWELLSKERISVFGTSAKFLSTCRAAKLFNQTLPELPDLRVILSTGSPLSSEDFLWVYNTIKKDIRLSSISGGTDIVSCFFLGNPLLPVHAGELQGPGLGMAVEVWSTEGQPITEAVGELVCVKPAPSMPVGFWDDPEGQKYRAAYFETFPGVWSHGDFAKMLPDRSVVILGRSDATLNPGGVRIGTAEIYRQVEKVPGLVDSLVVSQPWGDDERIVLFVVLSPGQTLDAAFEEQIRKTIRDGASPRHVPAKIISIPEVPYTLSGKKVELAVSRMLRGLRVDNASALKNPLALESFLNLPQLQT